MFDSEGRLGGNEGNLYDPNPYDKYANDGNDNRNKGKPLITEVAQVVCHTLESKAKVAQMQDPFCINSLNR